MPIQCFNMMCNYYNVNYLDHCTKPLKAILKCKDAIIKDGNTRTRLTDLSDTECPECGQWKAEQYALCYQCNMEA